MRPFTKLLFSALAAFLPASASAQGKVWVVDDDGGTGVDFTTIQEAVDAAANGDVVLVRAGEYGEMGFTTPTPVVDIVGKALVVTAERGEHVLLRQSGGLPSPFEVVRIKDLGVDQAVVLRGLEIVKSFFGTATVVVQDVAGSARLEDCRVRGEVTAVNQWSLQALNCADLTLVSTQIDGRGTSIPAVILTNTQAHFFETEVRGSDGLTDPSGTLHDGGGAVKLQGGSLVASGGALRGGDGGSVPATHCALVPSGDGGPALQVVSGQVLLSSVTLAGGAAGKGLAAGCIDGGPGAALIAPAGAVAFAADPPRSIRSNSPTLAGRSTVLALAGRPAEEALAVFAIDPAALFLPTAGGALLVGDPTAVLVAGPVQAWGSAMLQVPVPSLPAGVEAMTWHVQAVFIDPALGVRLGGVTALTVLAEP